MPSLFRKVLQAIAPLLATLVCVCAAAQPAPEEMSDQAVPARLSIAEGPVSFWRPGDTDWSPATVNLALAAGDALYAGTGATVEIQVGPRAYLRLMAGTQVTLTRQDSGLLQVNLAFGNASFDLRGLEGNQLVEIDTPNAAFSANANGYYRVDFHDDTTRFVVRRNGAATLGLRDGYNRSLAAGEQMIVRGSGELTAELAAAPPPDSWDRWNDARTDYYDKSSSSRYLPPQVYGAADLDQYGTWSEVPDYGTVWMPTVAAGWAPFSAGHWRWDPVYEWTWVDAAPWGWAPSHYGRWVFIGGRWAWAPGPRVVRPVYVPAVVAFLGFGGGPQVGWVALSWGEPVVPWWGRPAFRGRPWWGGWGGPRMVNDRIVRSDISINVGSITYRNSGVAHGVIAVRQEDFGRGHDHDRHFRFATPEDGRPAPISGALPIRRGPPAGQTSPAAPPKVFAPPDRRIGVPPPATTSGGSVNMPAPAHPEPRPEPRWSPAPRTVAPPASESRPAETLPAGEQRRGIEPRGRRPTEPAPVQPEPPAPRVITVPRPITPNVPVMPPTEKPRPAFPQPPAPVHESRSIDVPRRVEPPEPRREEPRVDERRERPRKPVPGQPESR